MDHPHDCPVVDSFDPFGRDYQRGPARALTEGGPVYFSPMLDAYVVTRYDDVRTVYRDVAAFSSQRFGQPATPLCPAAQAALTASAFRPSTSLATTDGPLHDERRKRLDPLFRAGALRWWDERIRSIYEEHIARIADRGRADLVADLFWEPPSILALEFMGVPDSDAQQLKEFSTGLLAFTFGRPTDDEQVAICSRMGDLYEFGRDLIRRLRRDPSGPGMLPFAVRIAADEPELFDDDFLVSLVTNSLVAAHETTTSSLTNATLLLLSQPAGWSAICADPQLIPCAVEECLRVGPPLTTGRRYCVRDTVVGGVTIPRESMVLLGVASANQDEHLFPDPAQLDLSRRGARRHLSFGSGTHYCLGAPFARLQMTRALTELCHRVPQLELVPDQTLDYIPSLTVWTPTKVDVRWTVDER